MRGKPKGLPKSGGRVAGTPNKITASVKAALTEAFDQLGGVDSLVAWGIENPSAFYPLWAKMLPAEVDVKSNGKELLAPWIAAFGQSRNEPATEQPADYVAH